MKKKLPLIFLLVAVLLAGLAALGTYRLINYQAKKAASKKVVTVPVVVAAREIDAGTAIGKGDLALRKWPKSTLPKGFFTDAKKVLGRVPMNPVVKGEIILRSRLAAEGLAGGMAALIPEGMRAVSVRVDDVIGVAGFIQPGDRVDIIATVQKGIYKENPSSRLLLQNVEVISVGEKIRMPKGADTSKKKPKPVKVKVATVLVEPIAAEKLALTAQIGKILMVMRARSDSSIGGYKGTYMTTLFPLPKQVVQQREMAEGKRTEVDKDTTTTTTIATTTTTTTSTTTTTLQSFEVIKGTRRLKLKLGETDEGSKGRSGKSAAGQQPSMALPPAAVGGQPGSGTTPLPAPQPQPGQAPQGQGQIQLTPQQLELLKQKAAQQ